MVTARLNIAYGLNISKTTDEVGREHYLVEQYGLKVLDIIVPNDITNSNSIKHGVITDDKFCSTYLLLGIYSNFGLGYGLISTVPLSTGNLPDSITPEEVFLDESLSDHSFKFVTKGEQRFCQVLSNGKKAIEIFLHVI